MPNSRKLTEDLQKRGESRRKRWKSVKFATNVVNALQQSVKSRKSETRSKSYKPKSEAIRKSGWRVRPSEMPKLDRRPSVMGPIDVNIAHMVLPSDLISQPSYETQTSQLSSTEHLTGQDFMLDRAGIQAKWNPSIRDMLQKLRKEPTYVSRSTNFTEDQLIKIKIYIRNWINSSVFSRAKIYVKILVVDFMNLYYFLKKNKNISDYWKIYNIIEFMIRNLMNSDGYNRIIICVQINKIDEPGFKELLLRLYKFLGNQVDSVLVLPAINKGTMDDFFVMLSDQLLEQTGHSKGSGFFVNDNYKDFTRQLWYKIPIVTIYDELMISSGLNEFIQSYTQDQRYNTLDRIVYIPHSTPRASSIPSTSRPYSMPFDPHSGRYHSGRSHRGMSHSGGRRTIKHKKKQKSKL
jgi:hypothetical protein